jgi:hypothetical protein
MGGVITYPAGHCNRCGADWGHSGAEVRLERMILLQHYLYDVPVMSGQRRIRTGIVRQNAGYLTTGVKVSRPETVREKTDRGKIL